LDDTTKSQRSKSQQKSTKELEIEKEKDLQARKLAKNLGFPESS